MKKDTKAVILETARKKFNQYGYEAISVLEIAKDLGMTRGNLAYHFKNKEALLSALAEEMWNRLNKDRLQSRNFPSFQNLHLEITSLYQIQKDYAFIYLNSHILNHPKIKKKFRAETKRAIADNKAIIAFSIRNGNMNKEPFPGIYNNLAFVTWMLTFYWFSQKIILGEKKEADCEKMIWSTLLPHFTDKGLTAFKSFFGKKYLSSLGKPFEKEMDSILPF